MSTQSRQFGKDGYLKYVKMRNKKPSISEENRAVTEAIKEIPLPGGLPTAKTVVVMTIRRNLGLAQYLGWDVYTAWREMKRPNALNWGQMEKMMDKAREFHKTRAGWDGLKAGAKVLRRPIINAKQERELQKNLYGD